MTEIDIKYQKLGGNNSFLGNPITIEKSCPDEIGHYRHFKHGFIHWHPNFGAYVTRGAILKKWSSLFMERGDLGYPVTDEQKTPDGIGRYQRFQGGFTSQIYHRRGEHHLYCGLA